MPKKAETELVELEGFPRRLRLARQLANLSQEKLAEAAGLDKGQISRFESGERVAAAHMATIIKLARALGQPTGWLAAEEGQPAIPVFREPTDRRRKPKAK
jgi:transcriptional regulator with XRE-family HTH domain